MSKTPDAQPGNPENIIQLGQPFSPFRNQDQITVERDDNGTPTHLTSQEIQIQNLGIAQVILLQTEVLSDELLLGRDTLVKIAQHQDGQIIFTNISQQALELSLNLETSDSLADTEQDIRCRLSLEKTHLTSDMELDDSPNFSSDKIEWDSLFWQEEDGGQQVSLLFQEKDQEKLLQMLSKMQITIEQVEPGSF